MTVNEECWLDGWLDRKNQFENITLGMFWWAIQKQLLVAVLQSLLTIISDKDN